MKIKKIKASIIQIRTKYLNKWLKIINNSNKEERVTVIQKSKGSTVDFNNILISVA